MITAKDLTKTIGEKLESRGYARKGKTWRITRSGVTNVINLQTSNYSQQRFMNVAFYLKNLGDLEHPKEEDCHVRGRASELFPDHEPHVGHLLDPSSELLEPDEHRRELASFVTGYLLPLCEELTGENGLARAIRSDMQGLWVTLAAKDALNG